MLKLGPREVVWIDLAGARIPFAPITRKAFRDAKRAGLRHLRMKNAEEGRLATDEEMIADAGDILSHDLIRDGILAAGVPWENVLGDDDQALPVNAETVELLLADPHYFAALDDAYIRPFMEVDREGNASAASPSSISETETAARTIADSAATPTSSDDAMIAPTSSTRPKRTRAKRSGK